jgi:large subunit ribosomal protein L18
MLSTKIAKKNKRRVRRKKHIHKIVRGTALRPRMVVFRSERQIYVQLVDDDAGHTITALSSLSPDVITTLKGKKPVQVGELVGQAFARKVLDKNFKQVVFDRNGFPYHGRVKAVAEGARKGGLQF